MSGEWPVIVPAQLVRGQIKLNRVGLAKKLKGKRDCELVVILEKKHATRSLAQNAWYFGGIVAAISDYTGYTPDEVHEFCKAKFLPNRVTMADKNGEVVEEVVVGRSTSTLNKIEFSDYIENIRKWAAESLDLNIHDPLPLERVG